MVIEGKYRNDMYGQCDLEEACAEWYMDNCHLWEDNYFQLLFDESNPSNEAKIIEDSHEQVIFYFFLLVCP